MGTASGKRLLGPSYRLLNCPGDAVDVDANHSGRPVGHMSLMFSVLQASAVAVDRLLSDGRG